MNTKKVMINCRYGTVDVVVKNWVMGKSIHDVITGYLNVCHSIHDFLHMTCKCCGFIKRKWTIFCWDCIGHKKGAIMDLLFFPNVLLGGLFLDVTFFQQN